MLLQETNLRPHQPVKVRGYACARQDRTTPRGSSDLVKGGGVMILVRAEGPRSLAYSQLFPLPRAQEDNTTETVGVRIHLCGNTMPTVCTCLPSALATPTPANKLFPQQPPSVAAYAHNP